MKQFDEIFRKNVKKAFSSYNADHLAEEGWNSFVAGRKGRRRITAVIPLWTRAASAAIIIGIGMFIAYKISDRNMTQEILSEIKPDVTKEEKLIQYKEADKAILPVVVSVEDPVNKESQVKMTVAEFHQPSAESDSLPELTLLKNEKIIPDDIAESRLLKRADLPVLPETGAPAEFPEDTKPEGLQTEDIMPEKEEHGQEKSHGRRTLLAGFSGLLAQSGGTASPASGLSVGFYLDQKLTRKISFRPGLALAVHSFGLEDWNGISEFNYSVPLYDGTSGRPDSYNGHLDMLAMELPLNFVFRIIEKERSGVYLSAGASTLIYISQRFTGNFVNEYTKGSTNTMTGEYSSETRYSTVEVENDYAAFSHADFFGLANLSAGYSFPYGKTGTLLIEPFIQLPINDLTSLDLRVRYGGVSMKLQFGKQENGK